jgi:hypothetical protein
MRFKRIRRLQGGALDTHRVEHRTLRRERAIEVGDLAPERLDRIGPLAKLQIDGLQADQQLDLISQSLSSRTVKNGPTRTRTWDQPVMSRSL